MQPSNIHFQFIFIRIYTRAFTELGFFLFSFLRCICAISIARIFRKRWRKCNARARLEKYDEPLCRVQKVLMNEFFLPNRLFHFPSREIKHTTYIYDGLKWENVTSTIVYVIEILIANMQQYTERKYTFLPSLLLLNFSFSREYFSWNLEF